MPQPSKKTLRTPRRISAYAVLKKNEYGQLRTVQDEKGPPRYPWRKKHPACRGGDRRTHVGVRDAYRNRKSCFLLAKRIRKVA